MGDQVNAQTLGQRQIIASLDREFARLHRRSCAIIEKTPDDAVYSFEADRLIETSVGRNVLRCAAVVEQTFGGITANLWDDPFEWTLPEHLSTKAKLLAHLEEVESLRQRAFASFTDDACLSKEVPTPSINTRPLIELLLETLIRAAHYQGRAFLALESLSRNGTIGFII